MAKVKAPIWMVPSTTAGLCGPGFLGSLPNSGRSFSGAPEDSLLQKIHSPENSAQWLFETTLPVTVPFPRGILKKVEFLAFSLYNIMSSANRDSFTSFLIWILFISFSCLIALAWTCSAMLNKTGENGHLCSSSSFFLIDFFFQQQF